MKKNIGDKSPNGSTYKVELNEREMISIDHEISKQHQKLIKFKEDSEKFINKHNHLIKVREEVATTPDEYLRSGIRTVNTNDLRKLIIIGCDEEINECLLELSKINDNFKQYYRE